MKLPDAALENSVLIVAHPDDEVLWFSSILEKVDRIVVCFLEYPPDVELADARKISLAEHPCRDRLTCLGMTEMKSFNKARWPNPELTDYGVRLGTKPALDQAYRKRASELRAKLADFVTAESNVFTHSPWGEYGHEDHVQISKVVTDLVAQAGARVWYSNYASERSHPLMVKYVDGFSRPYYSMPVDAMGARQMADTYYRHGAWTWLDDYVWFDTECFVEGPLEEREEPTGGRLFPVNFVRMAAVEGPRQDNRRSLKTRSMRAVKRAVRDAFGDD